MDTEDSLMWEEGAGESCGVCKNAYAKPKY